ncbi:hypothetical protein B5V89_15600 [Heyndrickxia sporothermodurans]|nr:hypothetical protein B5V89_15600 [Heyndrickxia sporothermodurans]
MPQLILNECTAFTAPFQENSFSELKNPVRRGHGKPYSIKSETMQENGVLKKGKLNIQKGEM